MFGLPRMSVKRRNFAAPSACFCLAALSASFCVEFCTSVRKSLVDISAIFANVFSMSLGATMVFMASFVVNTNEVYRPAALQVLLLAGDVPLSSL